MSGSRRMIAAVAVLTAASVYGCAYDPARIEVAPAAAVVNTNDDVPRLNARVRDRTGRVMPDARVVWSSSAPGIAAVDPARGVLTVNRDGEAVITAAVGSLKGTAIITVSLYHALAVDADALTLQVGETRPLVATITDSKGKRVQGEILWMSADKAIATVGPSGVVTAVAAGETTVMAMAKALQTEVKIEVPVAAQAKPDAETKPAEGPRRSK